ncbi:MAG: acyl-CoA dehydrogenase family protein [Myxococcota bacterium]|nr:acyl-CoA dehydrogenase family protein [Myxococcota bacterium]
MIDFELGDELELIRSTARDFAGDHLRPVMRAQESARQPSDSALGSYAEIGLATLEWPEACQGSGLGALARSLVNEELSAGCPGAALALDPLGPALYPLLEFGGESALETHGGPLLERAGARTVLVWNGAGSRAEVTLDGDRAHGRVPWFPTDRSDLMVILDETSAAVVAGEVQLTSLKGGGLRTAGASEVEFHDAHIVQRWQDPDAASRSLARIRLYTASMLLGVMRESAEYSREYALDRVAFGKPIAHHQALAFLIADMATAVESVRVLVWEAAFRLERGHDAREACATAFVEAAEQALFVTPNGVQILGGHGFMQDHPVEKFMREARALSLFWGGVDLAREESGAELGTSDGHIALSVEAR